MHIVNRILQAVGLELHRISRQSRLASELARLFGLLSADQVIDVGAHRGEYGRLLRDEVSFTGRVDSFEPLPTSTLLDMVSKDPDWDIHAYALGSRPGEAVLSTYGDSSLTSFHLLAPIAKEVWPEGLSISPRRHLKVAIERLDEIEMRLGRRVFLKIDTQGHDLEVLEGARGILEHVVGLQIEVPFVSIYHAVPRSWEVFRIVELMGFLPVAFFPITRVRELEVVEADVLFVRSQYANCTS